MRKLIATVCAVLMAASLIGCGADYSNTTIIGQVTKVDGTKVTLQLGEMTGMEMPEMSEGGFRWGTQDGSEMPETSESNDDGPLQWGVQDGSGMHEMSEGGFQWGTQGGNEMPEIPGGQNGETPEGFGGRGGMMPGAVPQFTAGEETLTVDLKDVTISVGFGQMTKVADISMVTEGSILVIEYGDNNTILSVTVQGGFGAEEFSSAP